MFYTLIEHGFLTNQSLCKVLSTLNVFMCTGWSTCIVTNYFGMLLTQNVTLYLHTVLCKSNDSEFRRISTKFYEILRKSAKFLGERIFGEISVASIVSPLAIKIRAAITLPTSKLTVALSGKTKFRTHFERRFVSLF